MADDGVSGALDFEELGAHAVRLMSLDLHCRLHGIVLLIDNLRSVQVQSTTFCCVLTRDEGSAIFARQIAVEHADACRSGNLPESFVVRDCAVIGVAGLYHIVLLIFSSENQILKYI